MLRGLYGFLVRQSWLRKMVMTTPGIRQLAWRFIAGENLDAGLAVVRGLNARGIKGTLNYVGTHVREESEAIAAADAAIEALRRIRQDGLDSHLSLKLTQIGQDVDEDFCRAQLLRVLDAAREVGIFVRVDREEARYAESSLRLFEEVLQSHGPETVGLVVQSYLRNRGDEVERLLTAGASPAPGQGRLLGAGRGGFP